MTLIDEVREAREGAAKGPWQVGSKSPGALRVSVWANGEEVAEAVATNSTSARITADFLALAPRMADALVADRAVMEKQNAALQSAEESIVAFMGEQGLGSESGAYDILCEIRAALTAFREATK